ncbi:MAG: sirohydrochlorin cobaltochelatase [Sphaerochaeta sp.]
MKKTIKLVALLSLLIFGATSCSTTNIDEAKGNTMEEVRPVILVVSFGTSYNSTRDKTIGAIERKIDEAYGDEYDVRRAFTSQFIINKLASRDNLIIDNVEEALQRCIDDGVTTLVVQPTHVMAGSEDDDMVQTVKQYADKFEHLSIGTPLLTTPQNYRDAVKILTDVTHSYDDGDTSIVYMGHGTQHPGNITYANLQTYVDEAGFGDRYFIGTVEATPTLEDMINKAEESGNDRVVLRPFMIVAGDHANNDMAGDEAGSWKTEFKKAGFDVECIIEGLGEIPAIQDMFVSKTSEAIAAL